jgi:hypothetical protein
VISPVLKCHVPTIPPGFVTEHHPKTVRIRGNRAQPPTFEGRRAHSAALLTALGKRRHGKIRRVKTLSISRLINLAVSDRFLDEEAQTGSFSGPFFGDQYVPWRSREHGP